jgi:flagellar hook-associated protein 3 FlgL
MTASSISNLGIQLLSTSNLQGELTNINQLTEQLASGQQQDNLTNYSPLDAEQLLSFQNAITQKQAYITTMQTVNARLQVYNSTMNDMENLAAEASQLATQNPTLSTSQTGNIQEQVQAYMQQAVDDLNQQIGDRYIYAGSRYSTQPVNLQSVLNGTVTLPFTPVTPSGSNYPLPPYDTDYNSGNPSASNPDAWATASANIDTGDSLTYGVTSTQTGFQQLIAGMQLINNAAQNGVSAATYQTDMSNAATLLGSALTNIQTYNTGVASSINTITQEKTTQNNDITSLQTQIGDIQNVDIAQVGTELNTLQTQLQASYSATAALTQDTLLKYL